MGRSGEGFEVHAFTVVNRPFRAILVKTQKQEEGFGESLNLPREYSCDLEQNVGRNMGGRGHSDEGSEGNEERVTGNWRKD